MTAMALGDGKSGKTEVSETVIRKGAGPKSVFRFLITKEVAKDSRVVYVDVRGAEEVNFLVLDSVEAPSDNESLLLAY